MRINNNIMAMNTHRQLGANQMNGAKSMEKLSSGLRINRAGDDAAGLAISEKMRGQIRGLNQASRNAQDGISMIQTAEGALNEAHSILQRMRELAVQSATDTNTAADRQELQKEADQLASELSRIGDNTEFNTQKLLNGDLKSAKFHIGANAGQRMDIAITDMRAEALGVAGSEASGFEQTVAITAQAAVTDADIVSGTYDVVKIDDYTGTAVPDANTAGGDASLITHIMVDASGEALATSTDGKAFSQSAPTGTDVDSFTLSGTVKDGSQITIVSGTTATANVEVTDHSLAGGTYTIADVSNNASYAGWTVGLQDAAGNIVALGATDLVGTPGTAATSTDWVDVKDTSASLLSHTANTSFSVGSEITVSGSGIDISNQTSADAAITNIDAAIQSVSGQRSELGAFQNRLEHTINNLGTSAENLQAAESRVRDLDMAAEMMEFTKTNILQQAATAMLAQANQAPQSVLQLLG